MPRDDMHASFQCVPSTSKAADFGIRRLGAADSRPRSVQIRPYLPNLQRSRVSSQVRSGVGQVPASVSVSSHAAAVYS